MCQNIDSTLNLGEGTHTLIDAHSWEGSYGRESPSLLSNFCFGMRSYMQNDAITTIIVAKHLCSLLRSRSALQITMKSSSLSSFNYIMFFFFFFLCQYFAVPVSALCPTRPNWIRRCMHPREYRGKGDAPSSLTSNLYWSSL